MTIQKYQKVLSIAEALLRKVDLPFETIQKYEELKLKILSEIEDFEAVTSNEENLKALKTEVAVKDQIINILMDYNDLLATSTNNIAEISTNIFSLEKLPVDGFFEVISNDSVTTFQERISTLSTRLTPLLTSLKPVSSLPINGYITTMTNSLSSKALKPLENLQFLSEIMKKQFEIVATIRTENKELLSHVETLETDNTVTAYAKTENESLKIKLSELQEKYKSETDGWRDEKLLLQNRVIECENELQIIIDLLDSDRYNNVFDTMEDPGQEPVGSVKGVGSRIERLVQFLNDKREALSVENEGILMKMASLCKDLDFKDDELARKNRLVGNLVGEVEDVMMCGEQTHLDILKLKDEYQSLVNNGLVGRHILISNN